MFTSNLVKHSILAASVVNLVGLPGFLGSNQSYAASINGGFESGDFTGWSRIGDVSIQTAEEFGSGPTQGSFEAFLSTASVDDDNFNFSGTNAVPRSEVEAFLGLVPASLNNLENSGMFSITEGAAIKQTFTANAGDTLSFDYNFLTDEFPQSEDFNSFAFTVLNTSTNELADTFSNLNSSSTFFNQETGFQTFSTVLPTWGTYTLGLGVVDRGEAYSSGLLVDNVRTTSAAVPEPSSTFAILTLSVLGGGLLLKRKQQQH